MRILVIEDDRKMATLLREALEKQLHRTVLAFNGIEGLEVARGHQFEAIVLDAMLPGMDGFRSLTLCGRPRWRLPSLC